ncbi:MAG TPA: Ig-like domain-containing protein [Candidatus Acidoferrales bacterium]|nr:Ig-like domain-containing protein [Candidatus Acidoferrales bacterium]
MSTSNVIRTYNTDTRRWVSLALITFGIAALAATTAHAASTQALISGEIERMAVNNVSDPWSGGTIVVGGQTVMIPRNLLFDLPANRLTLVQIFTGAPAGCAAVGESGLAKSDTCNNRTSGGFAAIAANRTSGGNVIAGDIYIEKGREIVTGVVTYINYTDGYLRVAGAPGSPTTGVMIRMNDPAGRHTFQQGLGCSGGPNCSPDPRFTLDADNYTHVFTTGYPLCLPSTRPRTFNDTHGILGGGLRTAQAAFDGTGDALCPATNRTINNGQPVDDSRRFAPVMLNDHITAEGNFETINGVRFLSSHTFKVSRALTTKTTASQPDYMLLDEVFIDAPGFQNKRARTLFIGFATIAPADILIWSLHYDPKTNDAHEFPLATTVGCDIADGAGTCTSQGAAGGVNPIFRVRHDVDLAINTKGKLDPCAHLRADPRFLALNPCPLNGSIAEQFAILSPIPHEIQARTGKKYTDMAQPSLFTLDVQGQDATWGQYLFPFGIGLGGIEIPDFFEVNLDKVSTPYLFSGIPWNLDRRLSPAGCLASGCESTPQPLDPFPFEGLDPRVQISFPAVSYFDPLFTATSLGLVQDRILSYVSGVKGNFDGNATVLAWPPTDPGATPILATPPLLAFCPVIVNISPIANDDTATAVQATATTVSLLGNDFDLDGSLNPASVTIVGAPAHGAAVLNGAGGVTYTSAAGFAGTDTFHYTVRDTGTPSAVSNTAAVTITVTAPAAALAPTARNDAASATAGIAAAISVLANDAAAPARTLNPATVVIVTQPGNGTANANAAGTVTFTANAGSSGNSTFTYNVKDTQGAVSNDATVTVAVNAPPVAHNDFPATSAATAVTIAVLANDTDSDGTLNAASVAIVSPPATGTAVVNTATGTVLYTPAIGAVLSDTFTYTVRDNLGAVSNIATVLVSITNQLPTANPDSAATTTGVPVVINVTANDTDPDGTIAQATVALLTQPANGTAVNNLNGTITYRSAALFAGTVTFQYRVSDNLGGVSNAGIVTVVVGSIPPTANNDTATAIAGQPVTINVLANDTDPDSPINPASVAILSQPASGTATVNPNGNGTIVFTGTASTTFTYTVADIFGGVSKPATVTITIGAATNAPVAVNDSASTPVATAVDINVLANDTGNNINPASVTVVAAPANGSAAVNPATGVITYTPPAGLAGSVTFTYRFSDDQGRLSNTAKVTVQVAEAVTTSRVQFTAAGASWRIDGSTNAPLTGETVTVCIGNTINAAKILGTTIVSNNGSFSLLLTNSARPPDATNNISIRTSSGSSLLGVAVTIR